jgi:uncharacterized protein YjdB
MRLLVALLALALIVTTGGGLYQTKGGMSAYAYPASEKVEIDDLWYQIDRSTTTVTIIGLVEGRNPEDVIIHGKLDLGPGWEGHVTKIAESAFEYCKGLESVTIEEGVQEIGEYAFYGCTKLGTITIAEGVRIIGEAAFGYCSSVSDIKIPNGEVSIGDWAFESCTNLKTITIPEGVTYIGDGALVGCDSLTTIFIDPESELAQVLAYDYWYIELKDPSEESNEDSTPGSNTGVGGVHNPPPTTEGGNQADDEDDSTDEDEGQTDEDEDQTDENENPIVEDDKPIVEDDKPIVEDDKPIVVPVASVAVNGTPANGMFAYKAFNNMAGTADANTLKLTAAVQPANAANKNVTWQSDNESVAKVDQNGLVTFTGTEGSVKIIATAKDGSGKAGSVTVKSVKNVTKIGTPLQRVYIQKGKSMTLPVVMYDGNVKVNSNLVWKSSNPEVLEVSQSGRITAAKSVKEKTNVAVVAKAANGESLKVNVTVTPKAMKLKKLTVIFPKNMTMKPGKSYNLKLKSVVATGLKVTFKSSNPSVVTVDKAGKLTALKAGKAKITVKAGIKKYVRTIYVK